MKYMGSKARISKEILPIILEHYKNGIMFIDACVGGANIIDKVPNYIERYGIDNNKYLIALYKGLQNNLDRPLEISKEYDIQFQSDGFRSLLQSKGIYFENVIKKPEIKTFSSHDSVFDNMIKFQDWQESENKLIKGKLIILEKL